MAQSYIVPSQTTLLPFLFITLEGWSRKTIKQRLGGGSIQVNGTVQTQHNLALLPGDKVEIGTPQPKRYRTSREKPIVLEILYKDRDLVAVNKPAGMLSVGTARESKSHALSLLRTQLSRGKHSVRLWPVHRLDRETSGILLFATSKEMREAVMAHWGDAEKQYLAIVEGVPSPVSATITQPLRLDKHIHHVHVGAHPEAKPAVTHYRLLQSHSAHRSLLEVEIETGRQHQIRAHMAWFGHSVVGDERYGTRGKRMGLHAARLAFIHPVSRMRIEVSVEPPRDFHALLLEAP